MKTLLFLFAALPLFAEVATITVQKDLPYTPSGEDAYQNERCKLDLYLPTGKDFPTLVWLHGGGLKGGSKDHESNTAIAKALASDGIAVAMVNYRLSPKAKYPSYVEDTANAIAWTITNIAEQGGSPRKIFLGGHSAGGYLALMVGMDPTWLKAHKLERSAIAGLIPVSGQTMTHYTVREERFGSDNPFIITADDASPVRYGSLEGIPPTLILCAENDMAARVEENLYLAAVLKGAGKTEVKTLVIPDRDHGSVAFDIAQPNDPARLAIAEFITATLTPKAGEK
ncbi:alpha/beta hydrolase fold domain-containing protein [Roseibacillus persicicus]|uniref:alpha/beta hydrolase n=1 Tax=Roseibacillus persicicus TaxID=454148 RepID=UPI00398AE3A7